MMQQQPQLTINQISSEVCYNATEYLQLKSQIFKACYFSEYLGLAVGLVFGAVIGILIYKRYRDGQDTE